MKIVPLVGSLALLVQLYFTPVGLASSWPDPSLTNHIISADADGFARRPGSHCAQARSHDYFSTNQFEAYLDQILASAHHWARTNGHKNEAREDVTRILVYVHGGLNKFADTASRAGQLAPVMMADTTNAHYPIFLAWPSGFLTTYKQHVSEIRQGVHEKKGLNVASAPIVVAVDMAKVPVTLPAEWWHQLMNLRDRTRVFRGITAGSRLFSAAQTTKDALNWTDQIESSEYEGGFMEEPFEQTKLTLLAPVRMTLGTLGQGTLAQESWRMMKRRTTNILFPPQSIQPIPQLEPIGERVNAGHLFEWLGKRVRGQVNLETKQKKADVPRKLEITLVGHSMGTIVLNKALTRYQHDLLQGDAVRNVVYMAAACSVTDARESLIPFLESSSRANPAKPVKFYNLTLNWAAEISEPTFKGLAPFGSLLEWIDQHLESPETILDRTLGSELNVMACLRAFSNVRTNCTFKSFDRYPNSIPTTHGDFNDCPYWRPEFWMRSAGEKSNAVHRTSLGAADDGKRVNCYPENWLDPDKDGRVDPAKALERLRLIKGGDKINDPAKPSGLLGQQRPPTEGEMKRAPTKAL